MGKLEGKIALITGGNRGIGFATAKRFVAEGAYVFITNRRETELANATKEIGRNVAGIKADISNLDDLDRLYTEIKRAKGRLDVIFANAGVVRIDPLGSITEECFNTVFQTNVKGVLFTVQKGLPLLSDGASIILNASIASRKGVSATSLYSASKAAVRSFARTWTTDLRARRIRVNAISPGPTDTAALEELHTRHQQLGLPSMDYSGVIPLGRTGTPDEIANVVVFLASNDSSFITGVELCVDGGMAQV